MEGSLEIPEPVRSRLALSGGLLVAATLGLLLWHQLGGTPWVIAWAACAIALALLTQRVAFQADGERDVARVVWTVAFIPVLVLRRVPCSSVREVVIGRVPGPAAGARRELGLVSLAGERPLRIGTRPTVLAARALGERIARTLRVPLRDASDGEDRVRGWEELDLHLGKRLRREGREPPAPEVPAGSAIGLRTAPRLELLLPAQPMSSQLLIGGLLTIAVAVLGYFVIIPEVAILAAVPTLAFAPVAVVTYARSRRATTLAVDGEGLELRCGRGRPQRIPFAALEELVEPEPRLLLLVSDRQRLQVPYVFHDPRERDLARAFIERAAFDHPSARGRLPPRA